MTIEANNDMHIRMCTHWRHIACCFAINVWTNISDRNDVILRHETFTGDMTNELRRSVFVSSDASIVLPYDPVRDKVLLVEQIRLGPIGRRDPVVWQMEPVAGLIDPGETPQETAHREAMEVDETDFETVIDVFFDYFNPHKDQVISLPDRSSFLPASLVC